MVKRSAREINAIIRDKMPGYHLARRSPAAAAGDSDAQPAPSRQRRTAPQSATPSVSDLRAKYLGSGASAPRDDELQVDEGEEAEIVTIEPDVSDGEPRHAKAVVISPDGEILGA